MNFDLIALTKAAQQKGWDRVSLAFDGEEVVIELRKRTHAPSGFYKFQYGWPTFQLAVFGQSAQEIVIDKIRETPVPESLPLHPARV